MNYILQTEPVNQLLSKTWHQIWQQVSWDVGGQVQNHQFFRINSRINEQLRSQLIRKEKSTK